MLYNVHVHVICAFIHMCMLCTGIAYECMLNVCTNILSLPLVLLSFSLFLLSSFLFSFSFSLLLFPPLSPPLSSLLFPPLLSSLLNHLQATAEANNLNAQNAARDRYTKEMEKVMMPSLCTINCCPSIIIVYAVYL